ncbi:DUF4276 family protein [Burkholderia multivorans]|uniref:DUF4276 family protein n=1 Tax=Burkholderia multivorans TaxID=87883 RepID=UPI001C241CE8|nr:DUF4276 family protein [Burkholderia multivorans]MBU9135118.1 DUF4276 family protein [Burkholderia multivorans]
MTINVFVVGEDELCCAIAEALLNNTGLDVNIYQRQNTKGEDQFRKKIPTMNNVAANVMPVLMIADADQADCVVAQRNAWIPANADQRLCVRLAVREAESWALADHVGFAQFADLSPALIPPQPELEQDPKQRLLQLIHKSRRRVLREEMLPKKGATSPVGLGYNVHITEYIRHHWRADRACERAPSLARAIPRVAAILKN